MIHPAFRYKKSRSKEFLEERTKNINYTFFPEGCYIWMKNENEAYKPAKVTKGFKPGDIHGEVAIVSDGKVKLLAIDALVSTKVADMDPANLVPRKRLEIVSPDLSMGALIHNARIRFNEDRDYFLIGESSLIYMNRFEDEDYKLERAAQQLLDKLEFDSQATPEPTIDYFAEKAYDELNLSQGTQSQACIFFGSRLSGIWEKSQDFIRKIVQLANPNDLTWWEKIVAANVVLHSFGGTKFIPWMETHLEYDSSQGNGPSGLLVGAAFENFLLDVTNLTNKNSIAFDCFYQLCGAAQLRHSEIHEEFEIHHKECYAYLNSDPATAEDPFVIRTCIRPGCDRECYALTHYCEIHSDVISKCKFEGCDDEEIGDDFCVQHGQEDVKTVLGATRGWSRVLSSFEALNIKEIEVKEIIHILSDILRFGNVDIAKHKRYGNKPFEGRLIYSSDDIFGVNLDDLVEEISHKRIRFGDEFIVRELEEDKANAMRDALVKVVYTGLFHWLTKIINRGVSYTKVAKQKAFKIFPGRPRQKKRIGAIGALTAQGLIIEMLEEQSNALEKLTNNYNQERLFEKFLHDQVRDANKYWKDHGISLNYQAPANPVFGLILSKDSKFHDKTLNNSDAISRKNFFRGKAKHSKLGILEILEDEMIRPGGSDSALVVKIETTHIDNPRLLPAPRKHAFMIQHYGAKVVYDVGGFVKNARSNVLDDEIYGFVLENTKDTFIIKLLTQHSPKEQQIWLSKLQKGKQNEAGKLEKTNSMNSRAISETSNASGSNRARSGSSTSSIKAPGKSTIQMFTLSRPRKAKEIFKSNTISKVGSKSISAVSTRFRKSKANEISSVPPEEITLKSSILSTGSKTRDGYSDFHIGKNLQERSTIVRNNVRVLMEILEATKVRYVHCVEANKNGSFEEGFDASWVSRQFVANGLDYTYSLQLNDISIGPGIPAQSFFEEFKALSANNVSLRNFCENLNQAGFLKAKSWKLSKSKKLFLQSSAFFDLIKLNLLASHDLHVYLQKIVRRFLARMRYLKMLAIHIEKGLEDAMNNDDLPQLEAFFQLANRCNHKSSQLGIAAGKIQRLKVEKDLNDKLRSAAEERDGIKLYSLLQEASKIGLIESGEFKRAMRVNGELELEKQRIILENQDAFHEKFESVLHELNEDIEFRNNFNVEEFISALSEKVKDEQLEVANENLDMREEERLNIREEGTTIENEEMKE